MLNMVNSKSHTGHFPARKFEPIEEIRKRVMPSILKNFEAFGIPEKALVISYTTQKPHLVRMDSECGNYWLAILCLSVSGTVLVEMDEFRHRVIARLYARLADHMVEQDLFWRKNLETGQLYIGEFPSVITEQTPAYKARLKLEAVNKWNRNQPRTWRYELPNPVTLYPFHRSV